MRHAWWLRTLPRFILDGPQSQGYYSLLVSQPSKSEASADVTQRICLASWRTVPVSHWQLVCTHSGTIPEYPPPNTPTSRYIGGVRVTKTPYKISPALISYILLDDRTPEHAIRLPRSIRDRRNCALSLRLEFELVTQTNKPVFMANFYPARIIRVFHCLEPIGGSHAISPDVHPVR